MNLREQLGQISLKYQKGGTVNIVDRSGNKVVLNIDSNQYRNLYESKQIQGYDSKTNTYYLTPSHEKVVYKSSNTVPSNQIEEVVLKGKKADWVKYREDYIKNNPKEKFIQEYLDAYPWAHQSLNNYPKRLDDDYENIVNNYIGEQIAKNKPQGDKSREDWLNSLSEKEQRFVQRNPKYSTSLWQDTVEGGKALFNLGNDLQISRIKNSDNYTNLEKTDLIQQHEENPILSNVGDVAQSLSFLTVPSKMVQSTLRPEYSFSDAIQGTKNKANALEDIGTDPLNLVGIGAWNKLSKTGKFSKSLESINIENILTDAEKYLTTKTPLSNAYKYNPWAFKPNPEMGYRMLGTEGYQDAINSGVLRAKPIPGSASTEGISLVRNTNRNPNTGKMQPALDRPYFADGFIDERYAADYMAAVNKVENNLIPISTHKGIAPPQAGSIPLENATLYKKDWLKGYKEIKVPEFKSEIDWSKWNKEIPENTQLMNEYNVIEQTSKSNGTWMKNSDGSKFKGTPEQFVQQNSQNFKRAFGDTPNIAYRGQTRPTETIGGGDRGYSDGISYLGDKDQAITYAETWKHPRHSGKIYQPGLSDPNAPALYELMYPNSTNTKIITHSEPRNWQKLIDDDVASQMDEVYLNFRGKSNKGEQFINTDDVGTYVAKNNLDHAYISNIMDYNRKPSRKFFNLLPGKNVGNTVIMNSKPGNYLKSRWYNNGMFDMTNPNIYKSVLPISLGLGAASQIEQKKEGGVIKDNNGDLLYAQEGGGLNNIRNILTSIYNKYE